MDQTIPSQLVGDEVRIKQVLINVLNNAVKYTSEGLVTLSIQCKKIEGDVAYVTYSVTDTGIGIRKDEINRVVKPFERLGEKEQRDRRNRTGNEYRQ